MYDIYLCDIEGIRDLRGKAAGSIASRSSK